VVVHEELKKVNVIVRATTKFGENILVTLKSVVDGAVGVILKEQRDGDGERGELRM